ncbi:MAG TPA: hypothetical protein VF316_25425 [Polyangiaceae bacterium]
MNTKLLLPLFASLALAGCAADPEPVVTPPKPVPLPSSDFETKAIYPSTSAQADGANLTVYAALLAKNAFLKLGPTDALSVVVGDAPEQPLLSQGQTYEPHYFATVTAPAAKTDVTIFLRRDKGEVAKIALTVPSPFTLSGAPASVHSGDKLSLGITPEPVDGDGGWWLILEGTCADRLYMLATFTNGKLVFDGSTLKQAKNAAASCPVTAKVQHFYVGKADDAFQQPFFSDVVGLQEQRFSADLTY